MLELSPVASAKRMRPDLKAEPIPGGFLLRPEVPSGLIVTLASGGTAALFVGVVLGFGIGPAAAAIAIGVIFAVTAAVSSWWYVIGRGLHPAEIVLDRWPVPPGESVTVKFRQRLKKPLAVRRLVPTLSCLEEARYRIGTDTRTARSTTHAQTLPATTFDGPVDELAAEWTFAVPAWAPPTFEAHDNKVRWALSVNVAIDSHPDANPSFPLLVGPGPEVSR